MTTAILHTKGILNLGTSVHNVNFTHAQLHTNRISVLGISVHYNVYAVHIRSITH